MEISEEELAEADKSLQEFFDSLGENDVLKLVFIEILLEEIYKKRVDLSDVIKLE